MIIGNMDGLPDDSGADLVLINGNILTIDPEESIAEALAVKDGKFLMVGTNNHVLKSRGKLTQVVYLKRKTVLLAYIGCHNHVPARPKWVDLYWVKSKDELVGLLRTRQNQRVSGMDAIRAFTIDVAYLEFEEDIKGSIEPGKLADFVVLDRDVLTCPEEDIKDIQVLATYLGGKVVYNKE